MSIKLFQLQWHRLLSAITRWNCENLWLIQPCKAGSKPALPLPSVKDLLLAVNCWVYSMMYKTLVVFEKRLVYPEMFSSPFHLLDLICSLKPSLFCEAKNAQVLFYIATSHINFLQENLMTLLVVCGNLGLSFAKLITWDLDTMILG